MYKEEKPSGSQRIPVSWEECSPYGFYTDSNHAGGNTGNSYGETAPVPASPYLRENMGFSTGISPCTGEKNMYKESSSLGESVPVSVSPCPAEVRGQSTGFSPYPGLCPNESRGISRSVPGWRPGYAMCAGGEYIPLSPCSHDGISADPGSWLDGEKNMGFVGLMKNDNGIVGIADSGVRRGCPTDEAEDDGRRKIFKSQQFILIMYGKNEYYDLCKLHPLSALISFLLEDFSGTHREFVDILYPELAETFHEEPDIQYNFIFGFREDWSRKITPTPEWVEKEVFYGSECCVLGRTGANYSSLDYEPNFQCAGAVAYAPRDPFVNPCWGIDEMKESCISIMESVISLGDKNLPHNSVGGQVITEELV